MLAAQCVDGAFDGAVHPEGQVASAQVDEGLERLEVDAAVLQRRIDVHLVHEVGQVGEITEAERQMVGAELREAVVVTKALHRHAGAVVGQVGAAFLYQEIAAAERQRLDAGAGGSLGVVGFPQGEVDVLDGQGVVREIDVLEVQPVEQECVPGKAAAFLLDERCDEQRQIGRAVVDVPDLDTPVLQADAPDAGLLRQHQRRGLDIDEHLAHMEHGVAGALDDVHIFQDQVVGEGEIDLAHRSVSVETLGEGLGDLSDGIGLHRGNLDGDEGGGRNDDHHQQEHPDYFLPGLHYAYNLTKLRKK